MRTFVPCLLALSTGTGMIARGVWQMEPSRPAAVRAAVAAPAAAASVAFTPEQGEANLGQRPVSGHDAAAARASVRHETKKGERTKVYHAFTFADGTRVEFSDRCRRGRERARRARVVFFEGDQKAGLEPAETFERAGQAAGLAPEAVAALRQVSTFEGGFDAINTWDSCRFSWGFIQFAGGRGLPRLLGHMKSRDPQRFAEYFGRYGVDVLPDAAGDPQPVYVTRCGRFLRGDAAEQAFGDDPLIVALFIRAARCPVVKQLQVEAAIEHYAAPALRTTWDGVALSSVLRSPKSIAMLIDRKVHEGNLRRFGRALDQVRSETGVADPASWPALEAQVMARVVENAAVADAPTERRLRDLWASTLPGPRG